MGRNMRKVIASTMNLYANAIPGQDCNYILYQPPPCNFNGDKRNMHLRHLTGGTTELIPRAS